MASIQAAVQGFDKNMNKMMLLMKELGIALEGVSRSFDALTSFSFSNDRVKEYVHHFSVEIVRLKEGLPFQNYNRLVHSDVLQPVQALKQAMRDTKKAATLRDEAYSQYTATKGKVDSIERGYAKKNKSLEESKAYPKQKEKREARLMQFHEQDACFQESFRELADTVERVAASTLKRYLHLNAEYMAAVIEALTKTDPTVESAVQLYGQQLQTIRQMRDRDAASLSSSAVAGGRSGATGGGVEESYVGRPSTSPAPVLRANGGRLGGGTEEGSFVQPGKGSFGHSQVGPSVRAATGSVGPAVTATSGNASGRGSLGTAAALSHSCPASLLTSQALQQQQAAAGAAAAALPPPLYSFSRGPQSVVSSVPPAAGYTAEQDRQLYDRFNTTMKGA